MQRLALTILLLSSYCASTFLGDAGLHELFCVDHQAAHLLPILWNDCNDAHCHAHAAEHSTKQEENQPGDQQHSDEDNCSLCQHVAKSQLEVVSLEIESVELLASQTEIINDLSPGITHASLHAPRGPPALL